MNEVLTGNDVVVEVATPAKKVPAVKKPAPTKNAVLAKKAIAKAVPKKAEANGKTDAKGGLRKPQLRILAALAKSGRPMDRKTLSEKAPVDQAACVEYVGSADPEVRQANDAKHFPSLVSLKLVKFGLPENGDGPAVYEITALGRKAIEKVK